ncbi:beta-ketoacyl-ACP synthase II [Candidatus Pinguicoccus supinus]|uniref:Nodulation protein E n=1 Tax=Candidatus Pinguicoccus supinus TaxID=2529394 RepID=A0A7T0FYE1_9BACT|nr:beta-ketoacyl-ACP synthase II [Candidatus Pinguicoccus supinus]
MKKFEISKYSCKIAADLPKFNSGYFLKFKESKRFDLYIQYALIAAKLALRNSKLDLKKQDPFKIGVFISSGIGGVKTFEDELRKLDLQGPRKTSPFLIPSFITNMASGVVAIDLRAKGCNFCITSACASSTHSVGEGFNYIRNNLLNIALVGGSESSITELGFAGFCAMKTMSVGFNKNPKKSSRPFDSKRDGFVMGAGSVILILENYNLAKERNSIMYCELVSYSFNCDASHITTPDLSGLSLRTCITDCIERSGLTLNNIDYINAHGTSTVYNDIIESSCIQSLLRDNLKSSFISSTKSTTGHLLGSAGALEIAISALAIFKNIVPPTINYEYPDSSCSLFYTPNIFLKRELKTAININLGFGGHNAVILIKKI